MAAWLHARTDPSQGSVWLLRGRPDAKDASQQLPNPLYRRLFRYLQWCQSTTYLLSRGYASDPDDSTLRPGMDSDRRPRRQRQEAQDDGRQLVWVLYLPLRDLFKS